MKWSLPAWTLVLAFGATLSAHAAPARSLEAPVKAAFLTKFGAFAEWPGGLLQAAPAMKLCIGGDDPFGVLLERTATGQAVDGKPITVVRLAEVHNSSGCQILYVSGSSRQSVAQALAAVRGQPVLTVTDAARDGARGMIHFVVFEDRVRFYVDLAEANRSGLSISSKLLSLALTVKR